MSFLLDIFVKVQWNIHIYRINNSILWIKLFLCMYVNNNSLSVVGDGGEACAAGRKIPGRAINAFRQTFPGARHFFQNLPNKSDWWCVAVFASSSKFMYRSALSYGDVARYLHINTSIIWIIQSRGGGADKSLPREMALVGGLTSFDVRIHDSIQLPLRFYDRIYLQFVGFDLLKFGVSIVELSILQFYSVSYITELVFEYDGTLSAFSIETWL